MKSYRTLLLVAGAVLLFAGAMMLVFHGSDREDPTGPAAGPVDDSGTSPVGKRDRDGGSAAGTVGGARPDGGGTPDRGPGSPAADPGWHDPGFASDAVAMILDDQEADDITVRNRLVEFAGDSDRPLQERCEALDHAFRLTFPDEISPLVSLASSSSLPGELHDQILDGAMNFTGAPRLQLMLALLERAEGERRETLLDNLRFHTGEDHGDDLAKWRVAIEVLEPEAPPE